MCGLIGYIGKNACQNTFIGLKGLEYRGYDSAGLAFIDKNKIKVVKQKGFIKDLKIPKGKNICIGHTRWATHGAPSDVNAHPHLSENQSFAVVHNGIIENYGHIKEKYLPDVKFQSETDTEVIPNLIEKFFNGNMIETLQKIVKILEGSFVLCILQKKINKVYFVRKDSPLILGESKKCYIVASDVAGLVHVTNEICYLPNLSIGYICPNDYQIFDFEGNILNVYTKPTTLTGTDYSLGKFNHYMHKEIYQIPTSISSTINYYLSNDNALTKLPKEFFDVKNIFIVACGTSYHSGLMGKKILENNTSIKVDVEIASEFIYNLPTIPKGTLFIFISQSGETADTIQAIKKVQSLGFKTICITNVENSTIPRLVDHALLIKAGVEICVASTKAYISQVLMFYIICAYINSKDFKQSLKELEKTADFEISEIEKQILEIIPKIKNCQCYNIIGRNTDYISAQEGALKIKEIAYIPSLPCPSGELKHGSLALVDESNYVVVFATEKELLSKSLNAINEIKSRGGNVIVLSQYPRQTFGEIDQYIALPNLKQNQMPLCSVIPCQLIAYHLALTKNLDPDKPRNLAKSVTVE